MSRVWHIAPLARQVDPGKTIGWFDGVLCGAPDPRGGEASLAKLKMFPLCPACMVELDRYQELGLIEIYSPKPKLGHGQKLYWKFRDGVERGGTTRELFLFQPAVNYIRYSRSDVRWTELTYNAFGVERGTGHDRHWPKRLDGRKGRIRL